MKDILKTLSLKNTIDENKELLHKEAEGDVEVAYCLGMRDGQIYLARSLLKTLDSVSSSSKIEKAS